MDLQPKMLEKLHRRAIGANVERRIETRECSAETLALQDLDSASDVVLAIYTIHEAANPAGFVNELACCLTPGGHLLVAEPREHVDGRVFDVILRNAETSGLTVAERPAIRFSRAAWLRRG